MKHRIQAKKLNRDTNHRKMLLRNLVRSLIETGEIVTTVAKAKETRRIADSLIGKAKVDSITSRRNLHRFFGTRDVVNTLVEKIAPEFTDRVSGFTRITPVGSRRGDNTKVVSLAFVKKPATVGSLKKPKTEQAPKPEVKKVATPKKAAKKT